jgi:hypothetical protein
MWDEQIRPNNPTTAEKLRRISQVNKTLRILFCCALALTVVSFAAAQDLKVGHLTTGAILPPAAMYTNCGTGCTSYNTASGYYVSGTANTDSAGQVLAVQFTANGKTITKVIEANSQYVAPSSKIGAILLKDASGMPGGALAGGTLKVVGACPPATGSKPCTYKPKKAVKTKKAELIWLCQYLPSNESAGAALWMLSNSDTSNGFAFINGSTSNGTCLKEPWASANGATRSAFEID